ncbi:hypothetical protein K440DRAFT_644659 [Wilcoxina mikolae CBS 423.85]|nr:hypothetical protein K440DRAFT_644659 [Wilcoxina mikolae CBS 423.85]
MFNLHPFPVIRPRGPYKDADLSLIFVRGDLIQALEPSSDPVFTFLINKSSLLSSDPAYGLVRPQGTIACIETAMFCTNSRCTPWLEVLYGFNETHKAYLSEGLQKDKIFELQASGLLMSFLLAPTSMVYAVLNRDSSALQASKFLQLSGTQFKLYPEQWKFELNYWFSLGLAKFQLGFFTTIQAQSDLDVAELQNYFDEEPNLQKISGRVKFRSAQHTTLSVLGIAVILGATLVMTVISYLDVVFKGLFKRSRMFGRAMQKWEATENLQLLKAAEKSPSGLQENGSQHEDLGREVFVADKKVPV